MKKTKKIVKCKKCRKYFEAQLYRIKKDEGKYCSYKCYWQDRKGKKFSIPIIKKCAICNKEFITYPCHLKKNWGKYCSRKCMPQIFKKGHIPWIKGKHPIYLQGKNHPMWKGGKTKDSQGYILIYQPFHPRANHQGYARKGHLVMEKYLKRYLKPEEIVHHINKIITDDRIKNLKLFSNQSEHRKFHINS